MKSFIRKTVLFLLAAIMIFTIFSLTGSWLMQHKSSGIHIVPPEKEYVILGNSRPTLAFNDSVIDKVYNFASVGESYFYTYLKAEQLLKHNKHIKGVFLEYNLEDIGHKRDAWTWGRSFMQNNCIKYSYGMHWYNYNTLLKNNPSDFLSVQVIQAFPRQLKYALLWPIKDFKQFYGGYHYTSENNMDSLDKDPAWTTNTHLKNISDFHKEQLLRLLALFKEKNIKVYLIRSPLHHSNGKQLNAGSMIKFLGEKNKNLEYLDFNNFPASSTDFKDPSHLNYRGALKFSKFFNRILSNGLLTSQHKETFIELALRYEGEERLAQNIEHQLAEKSVISGR